MNRAPSTSAETLRKLSDKLVMFELFRDWLAANHDLKDNYHLSGRRPPPEAVFAYLNEQFNMRVVSDGSVCLREINSVVRKFLTDLNIIVYHHTSTAQVDSIRDKGLIPGLYQVGRKDEGSRDVYVTTEKSGPRPALFSKRACDHFGGSPIALMCRVPFSSLRIDKDESDCAEWQIHHVVNFIGVESIVNLGSPASVAA